MGKLKNGKDIDKDEVTGEMMKSGGDRVVDWILRRHNMAFESGVVLEDKDKREKMEYSYYGGISLLNGVKYM